MSGRGRDLLIPAWAKSQPTGVPSLPIGRDVSSSGKRSRFSEGKVSGAPGTNPPNLSLLPPPGVPPPLIFPNVKPPQKKIKLSLPETSWKQYTKDGKTYYHSSVTNKSVWEEPPEFKKAKSLLEKIIKSKDPLAYEAQEKLKQIVINADEINLRAAPTEIKKIDLTKIVSEGADPFAFIATTEGNSTFDDSGLARRKPLSDIVFQSVPSTLSAPTGEDLQKFLQEKVKKLNLEEEKYQPIHAQILANDQISSDTSQNKEEMFLSALKKCNIGAKDSFEDVLRKGIMNFPEYNSVQNMVTKKSLIEEYQARKQLEDKKLYQKEQHEAETNFKELLKQLSETVDSEGKPLLYGKMRRDKCYDVIYSDKEHRRIFDKLHGKTLKDRLISKFLHDLYLLEQSAANANERKMLEDTMQRLRESYKDGPDIGGWSMAQGFESLDLDIPDGVKRRAWSDFLKEFNKNMDIKIKKTRTDFYDYMVACLKSGKLDIDKGLAKKDTLKKIQEVYSKGTGDISEIHVDEKYLLANMKTDPAFIDLIKLENGVEYVIKEYKYAMSKIEKLCDSIEPCVSSITKIDSFSFNPSKDLSEDTLFQKLSEFCKNNSTTSEVSKLLRLVKNDWDANKVVLMEAVGDFVKNMLEKREKAERALELLLKDVVYKTEHLNVDFDTLVSKISGEKEFIKLQRFEENRNTHVVAKRVFDKYMDDFQAKKASKKEAPDTENANRIRARSNSSDKEDGEIPEE